MKLTAFILVLSVISAFAGKSYSQTKALSLNISNSSVKEVLQNIESQSEFVFMYSEKLIDVTRRVSIDLKNRKIDEVLEELFAGSNVTYKIKDRFILLSPPEVTGEDFMVQQQKTITGKVTDTKGQPLPGVTVVVKGTTSGTITNADGTFVISNVPKEATLVFSFVGMKTQEVVIGNQTSFTMILEEETMGVDEVVVVGYGIQKKVNLTGSVAALDGESLQKRPIVNATQSLQGMVPGLIVSTDRNSGKPGAKFNLNIRGMGNLKGDGSDGPYTLVDGIEMSLADINPNDIESVSVLKDAAASAIYGARAAYGVIIVTTRKGHSGKPTVTYSGNSGWSSSIKLPEMVNSYEFAKYLNKAVGNTGAAPQYSDAKLALLQQYIKDPAGINSWPEINANTYNAFINNSMGVGNTNYFNLHYKDFAFKQNHNISVSGGSDNFEYYASGGYYDEDGILRWADMGYKRFNLDANLNAKLNKWMSLKLNTKFTDGFNDSPFGEGALNQDMFFHNLARLRPTYSAYDLYGNFAETTQIPYLQSGTKTKAENSTLGILTGMEIEPLKNWKIFIDYNLKLENLDYNATNLPAKLMGINGDYYLGLRSELEVLEKGAFLRNMARSMYNTINVYSSYSGSFMEKHNIGATLGFQQEYFRYSSLKTQVKDLISFTNPGINIATGDKITSENRYEWATRGYFGRLSYDYMGKYLFELNARADGSSRFAPDSRWGFFPSASIGYNLAREPFMKKYSNTVSTFKLRGSYGFLGNQSGAGLYTFAQSMGTAAQGTWFFQNGRELIIWAPGSFNPDVTWEKIENIDIGLDFALFKNQLTGTLDVYQRTTREMLGPTQDFADLFGATPPQTNNATLRNRGWELGISWKGNIGENLEYGISGMITDYITHVLDYENPTLSGPNTNWYAGKKVGEIWGYRVSGIIQTQSEADEYNSNMNLTYLSGQKWKPGDIKYIDLNGDKKINIGTNVLGDMGDLTTIGNNAPRFLYSINGFAGWKNLSLSMMWQGVGKRDYSPAPGDVYFWGSSSLAQVTVFTQHLDYWRSPDDPDPNPDAYYPNPYAAAAGSINNYINKTQLQTDRYLQNGAYIRLKNLIVNYDLPAAWTEKIKMNKVSIYVSGENLLTFTRLAKMLDPEQVFSFNEGSKSYPLNKVYSLGLIVKL